MSNNEIKLIDFGPDTAIVSTENLYRVVFHGVDREPIELLTAEDAIAYAGGYNGCFLDGRSWAEIVDYETAQQRREWEDEHEVHVLQHERATKRPGLVRRLAARAAALIW